mgnify:CR=1 FL=1
MADDNLKVWLFLGAILLVLFFIDSRMPVEVAAIGGVNLSNASGGTDFGGAAVDWFNMRGELEQNILIYGSITFVAMLMLFGLTRKGG